MSKKISQLFLTRGVPGTHDTKMLFNCIKKLTNSKFKKIIYLNLIKQSMIENQKKMVKSIKKPNIVIFEGWCVGA